MRTPPSTATGRICGIGSTSWTGPSTLTGIMQAILTLPCQSANPMSASPSGNPVSCVRGALALERAPSDAPLALALDQVQAGELAALVAKDLAGFVAGAGALDLCMVAAHYDPAELLRPGWPLHRSSAP